MATKAMKVDSKTARHMATAKALAERGLVDAMIAEDATAPPPVAHDLLARITETARTLRDAQGEVQALTEQLATASARVLELRIKQLPALMDEAQVSMLALDDDANTYIERAEEVYASISKANAAQACAWLDANGYGSLVKSSIVVELPRGERALAKKAATALRKAGIEYEEQSGVHAQTLKAFVRESLAAGRALPPAITYHVQPVVDLKAKRARKPRTTSAVK